MLLRHCNDSCLKNAGKRFIRAYVQFEAHLPVLVEPPVQRTNFVAKLGKVKRTLLFVLLQNDEDGNRLIDQAWKQFWHVAFVPLSYVNNSLL